MDTRLVHCFNKLCKSTNANLSKCFHFICYEHMMKTHKEPRMDELDLATKKDAILNHITEDIDVIRVGDSIMEEEMKLIFPVCGKRCYNTVTKEKIIHPKKHLVIILLHRVGTKTGMRRQIQCRQLIY